MTAPERPQTYVRRRGRMTRAQARALDTLAPRYLLDSGEGAEQRPPRWADTFGREVPLGVEIGFGMGQGLVDWAQRCPDWNLLGIEVYLPGIGSALLGLDQAGAEHVRLVDAPAEWVLDHWLAPGSVDQVRIFFPDPWPKKRHHKRRLVRPDVIARVADRLKPGGLLWLATDVEAYAAWMLEVLAGEPALARDEAGADDRPRTRFEARGLALGHGVYDLRYRRRS
ncbi:MAG: tRNA (guanosine(46)-N7)-methyltransferase TrmB [Pseudomonadales bacterium]